MDAYFVTVIGCKGGIVETLTAIKITRSEAEAKGHSLNEYQRDHPGFLIAEVVATLLDVDELVSKLQAARDSSSRR